MFKKPFNRIDGEIRVCAMCEEQFHTMKPINKCPPCTNEWNKQRVKEKIELGIIKPTEYKERYPFDTTNGEAASRFKKIQKELKNCYTKEERRAFYQKQLQEAEQLGILEWINDRRGESSKERVKRDSTIKRNIPDTRYMDWDDFERGGWGDIEDS
jgi:hypothetical protein